MATLAGTVTMFVVGYLLWGIALVDVMEGHTITNVMKDPPDFVMLLLSHIIASFALSNIYGKWSDGNYGAGDGFNFGIWVGIFTGISYSLLGYATANLMDLTGHLIDGVVTLIFFTIVGIVIGIAYKAAAPKAAS